MKLSQLLEFDNIIVQCHNNPDADALASGYAVLRYLKSFGKNAKFVYGGNFEVAKSNLKLMIGDLGIDVYHVRTQEELASLLGLSEGALPELLVTVDGQYSEGNIQHFEAKEVAIIDHHQVEGPLPVLSEVRSYQASCATVVWDMLRAEGLDVNHDIKLATALYYGLLTDSNNFSELHHPVDMDMRDELKISSSIITKFKNSNISQEELRIAGIALLGSEYYRDNHYAIVKTDPCDPNVLGIISDMLLEVEDVECCLVYSIHESGIKISVRSCVKEVKADELAQFICEGVGNGGGHLIKAGGSIQRKLLEIQELDYNPPCIQQFFRSRMQDYFYNNDIIYAGDYNVDITGMKRYVRKSLKAGYVVATDVLPVGTKAVIRTIQGDVKIHVQEDTIIVIGIRGEVSAISRSLFDKYFKVDSSEYVYPGDYIPTIRRDIDGRTIEILPFAHSCVTSGNSMMFAKELNNRTKVFTKHDPEHYLLGKPGDYIGVLEGDTSEILIFERELFEKIFDMV
ncbi:nanoRNase/pAp phosphatase, hydrolyzes c-di-AMP and oligoRNAs [Pseudobutyrivibrio sp. OR37]|uniref:DHH family phosphoesterase n=1 Tax=Pseudobutyrivibrio sp. OR37 TaxID=1798186 RepID=UPI0008EB247B|nr:DHH family phosphoesterase [Pseudobutyrivibrio sp. OR37]SFH78417.1 nanoRNase/pAp phosphatase, hydrolyzes c-di-AMP and oligoRNAs [Pseudobutyrivibrio sp. OR37]